MSAIGATASTDSSSLIDSIAPDVEKPIALDNSFLKNLGPDPKVQKSIDKLAKQEKIKSAIGDVAKSFIYGKVNSKLD